MLGTHRVLAVLLLTAAVSISLSNSQGFFNRLFSKGAGYFSSSGTPHSRAPARTKASSPSSWNATSGIHHSPAVASHSSRGFNNGGGGWGWNVPGGSFGAHHVSNKRVGHVSQTKASSRSVNVTGAASSKSVSEARGGGGGGGGWGWGWPQHNNKGGTDYNMVIGALALLSLLGLGAFGFNRPAATNIVILNASGRRRRAADDFDDDMIEGETLPQFLNRMGKYLDMSWGEEKNLKKVEPLKLY